MALGRVQVDADQEGSATVHGNIDSRPVAGGRRIGVPLARDPDDGHATRRHESVCKDIGALPSPCLFYIQASGNGAKQIICGSAAAHSSVRIEYENAVGDAGQERAEAGRSILRYGQGCERDLERRQQCAAKQNLPQSSEAAMR